MNIFKGRGRRRAPDGTARLHKQVRDLKALQSLDRQQIADLVSKLEDEKERWRTADRQRQVAESLIEVRERELEAARSRHRQAWEQVKTLPPTPYPAAVTVLNAMIPAVLPVLPVKPAKSPLNVPPWAPSAVETTQPIPLAQRERHQPARGAANQDAETTQELPRPQPQQAAS